VGKGIGCIATKEILPGCLVLRETPALYLPPEEEETSSLLQRTITAFLGMTKGEQEIYLCLANMFDKDESEWSETARKDMENLKIELEAQPLTDLSPNDITMIWQIKLTNGFHNGVFLKMSRFNHSCWPNAEYFWTLTREERRTSLRENFNFDCCCIVCNASQDHLARESEDCDRFLQLSKQRLNMANDSLDDLFNEIQILKRMHKLAVDMKIIKNSLTLKYIIESWFDASCQGFLMADNEEEETRNMFLGETFSSASLGVNISGVIYGEEHSNTLKWVQRERDPINFFLNEHFPGCKKYIY